MPGPAGTDVAQLTETVRARGHDNVTARHGSTFELTTDDYLTPAGDCILGVRADRAPADFAPAFAAACRDATASVVAEVTAAGRSATVAGRGHPDLTFADDRSLVVRTSDYVDDRTVMVHADASAADLDRGLLAALADGAPVTLTLTVIPGDDPG